MIASQDISVIIQGAIQPAFFSEVVHSVRSALPHCELVVSTWCDSLQKIDPDVAEKCDKILGMVDPGPVNFHKVAGYEGWKGINCNSNRQIVSTRSGLKLATRKYGLKLRADTKIETTGFLDAFSEYHGLPCGEYFSRRVITGSCMRSTFSPFYISDMFQFGYIHDLVKLWSIPLQPDEAVIPFMTKNEFEGTYLMAPEQFLWSSFVRLTVPLLFNARHDTREINVAISENLIFGSIIPVSHDIAGLYNLKYPELSEKDENLLPREEWFQGAQNFAHVE